MNDEPTHYQRLVSLRDDLTERLSTAQDSYVAGIARQLQAVLIEIERTPDPDTEPTTLDVLQAARAQRRSGVQP